MKKRMIFKRESTKKVIISLSILLLLLFLVMVFACGSRQPGRWRDTESQEITERHRKERIEHLWDYLDNFKDETVENVEVPAEIARITEKNALIKEYTDYVNNISSKEMTDAEYEEHYDYLMGIFSKLCKLEPDPTPEEYLVVQLDRFLFRLEDELYFCKKFGEKYIKSKKINLSQLNGCIKDLTTLREKINTQPPPYEQMKQEYMICLEEAAIACPEIAFHFFRLE